MLVTSSNKHFTLSAESIDLDDAPLGITTCVSEFDSKQIASIYQRIQNNLSLTLEKHPRGLQVICWEVVHSFCQNLNTINVLAGKHVLHPVITGAARSAKIYSIKWLTATFYIVHFTIGMRSILRLPG